MDANENVVVSAEQKKQREKMVSERKLMHIEYRIICGDGFDVPKQSYYILK
jgi:hypothetical protein